MKTNWYQAANNYKLDDIIWACAYEYNYSKEGKYLHCAPILGEFKAGETAAKDAAIRQKTQCPRIQYFVPYKKNGKDLAWSKAVGITSRLYADTEQECIEVYNNQIDEYITWHEKQIAKLMEAKV